MISWWVWLWRSRPVPIGTRSLRHGGGAPTSPSRSSSLRSKSRGERSGGFLPMDTMTAGDNAAGSSSSSYSDLQLTEPVGSILSNPNRTVAILSARKLERRPELDLTEDDWASLATTIVSPSSAPPSSYGGASDWISPSPLGTPGYPGVL